MNQNEAIYALLGIIFGTLSSFAVFRARFVALEKDVESLKDNIRRIETGLNEAVNPARDRREREMLILLASIAKRIGAANRHTDVGHYVDEPEESP